MKKTVYLIHHSHTDIGYTHPSEILKVYHRDFINQAVEAFAKEENSCFRWTCENFWQIENYLKTASESEQRKLITLMKSGHIDYSLNYLNMTELIDMDVYDEKIIAASEFSKKNELGFDSAMTADINGYSQRYVEILAKNGVKNNFSCIHTHHGAHAFGKKPYIFNWETKYGNVKTVLTAHYHIGNELFIMPDAGVSYLLADDGLGIDSDNTNLKITENRIFTFLDEVKEVEGYTYDFIPMMVSGINTDNGTPNPGVLKTIEAWNSKHGDNIELKLVTLNQFFKEVESETENIPTYSGDMNDWWADGVGSTPKGTKLFKSAQRKYILLKTLNEEYDNQDALRNLILYAEHTWGHSASISNPYNTLVDEMMLKKQTYAAIADMQINEDIELYLLSKDKVTILPNRNKVFNVTNVLGQELNLSATIIIEHWETVDGQALYNTRDDVVVKDINGTEYPCQVKQVDRGHEVEFCCTLGPKEAKLFKVEVKKKNIIYSKYETCDKANDFKNKKTSLYLSNEINTDRYILKIDKENDIISIFDKIDRKYISKGNDFLKYIITCLEPDNQMTTRKAMGRNRISSMGDRHVGTNLKFELLETGLVYTTIRVHQTVVGLVEAYVDIKVYHSISKIEVVANYLKQASRNVENIYINFNIESEIAETLMLTKCGDELDINRDLLPEANNMFFIAGEEVLTEKFKVLTPDCSLVTFDNGLYMPVDLYSKSDKSKLCFWLANNFWETNFFNDLSGCHSFRFTITGEEIQANKISFENPIVYSTKEQF